MELEQYVELFAVNYDLSEELADDIVKALRQTRSEQEMRLLRAYNEAKAENTRLRAACQFTLDIAENKVIGNWDDVMLEMRLVLAKARS